MIFAFSGVPLESDSWKDGMMLHPRILVDEIGRIGGLVIFASIMPSSWLVQ